MRTTFALIGSGVAALGVWLYLRVRTPKGSVTVSGVIVDPISGSIVIESPDIQVSMPSVEFDTQPRSILEEIAVTARKIASTVSNWTQPRGEKYRALFNAVEMKYGIPHGLLFRQAYQESRFRDDIITGKVRSSAGAVGIMQIVPKYHPEVGEAGALDVPTAVNYAGKILAAWKKQFGSWPLALAAYNAGPGNVNKYGGIPPFKETQDYVAQITADVKVYA